jgi:hypothetical protein
MNMDYKKELESYPDASPEDKAELEKLAGLQKDIAISGSAEDFIRHPFFKAFENHMNDMISDSKSKLMTIETLADLQAYKAGIAAIVELKQWLNSKVIAGRVAKKAIEIYEQDTEDLNARIQEAVDDANKS